MESIHTPLVRKREWLAPALAYASYTIFFAIASFEVNQSYNYIGAFILLVSIVLSNHTRMFSVRADKTVVFSILLFSVPILVYLSSPPTIEAIPYLIKFISLFLLYLLMFSYGYTPLKNSQYQKIFIIPIFAILALSLSPASFIDYGGHTRLKGLFANPNGLAQMAISLWCFNYGRQVLENKKFIAVSAFILLIIILTGTSGAFIGCIIGLTYVLIPDLTKKKATLILVLLLSIACFMLIKSSSLGIIDKLTNQTYIVLQNKDVIISGKINYGEIATSHTASGTSALWRLSHWVNIFDKTLSSSFWLILFGHGIGSTVIDFGILPHNDYLRVLYEQGILGFIIFISFFVTIFRRLARQDRLVFIIIAVYAFSENLFDNFLFMSLFFMFLSTSQQQLKKPFACSYIR